MKGGNSTLVMKQFNHAALTSTDGEGDGTPLQYSSLENPMDGGAWWAAVHGVAKSWTWLSDITFTFHFHALEKEMATHSSVLAWRIPGTRGAWWAAVYGVAQSRTRLKWLSSIIVLLLISPFILVSICLTYCGAPMLGSYICIIVISFSWIDPLIIM